MNLIGRMYIKTSTKLKVKKKDGKLIVKNTSNKRQKLLFIKPIITQRTNFMLDSQIVIDNESDCQIKILNKRFKVCAEKPINKKIFLPDILKGLYIGISIAANTECVIEKLMVDTNANEDEEIEKFFKSNVLLLCPGYPDEQDKYNCSFIHSRVSEYAKYDINVDVAVVNELFIYETQFYSFEGKRVCRTGYNQIRTLLLNKHYDKILIHFPSPEFYRILDAVDIRNTQVILYSHGADTLYHDYQKIGAPYFTNEFEIPAWFKASFRDRDEGIVRYNNRKNFKFVFVTDWNRKYSEKLLDIKYNNYDIVPCFIDDKLYSYTPKDPELRKKIFVIRPQNDIKSYAIDLNVRTILELSHRECFKDLEFSIYGDGTLHDILMEPLRKFENVHIYKKFLTHEEIAQVHKENGIGLFASRFDNQAVSLCEAAMSGCIGITSKGIGAAEFVDEAIGTYCDTEDYKQYADLIEKLYNDPKLFSEMSEKMHNSAFNTCSYEHSLKKDIDIIKNFNEKEKIIIPTLKDKPLLSVSIAAYNCSKFIVQVVSSLLRSKHADELEILVVNDGSKDDTVKTITEFVEANYTGKGNPNVRIIDKENGGHGSTINKGIELATGKYFKLLDGDDYYVAEELDKLLEKLKEEDSDLILTNYIEDFSVLGQYNRKKLYEELTPGIKYRVDDVTMPGYGFSSWGPLLSTACYKTKLLKDSNFKIDEHCFYVDMEYNLNGMIQCDTVTYYPYDIYSYYLGRDGQSVSPASYKKNVKQHEKVCLRVIKEFVDNKDQIPEGKQNYIFNKMIVLLCKTQYDIVIDYHKNGKYFREFEKELKQFPEIYNDYRVATNRVKFHRRTGGKLIWANGFLYRMKGILHI